MGQPVIKAVQGFLIVLVPLSFCLPCGKTFFIVYAVFERRHLRKCIDTFFERNLCGGEQVLVFLCQVVLLLHLRDDLRGEGFQFQFCIDKQNLSEFFFEVLAERALHQRQRPLLQILLQLRHGLVPEFVFFFVKLDSGVDGMADGCQRRLGHDMAVFLIHLEEDFPGLLIGRCVFQRFRQLFYFADHVVQLRAIVWHFRKFHIYLLLRQKNRPPVTLIIVS